MVSGCAAVGSVKTCCLTGATLECINRFCADRALSPVMDDTKVW